MTTPEWNFRFTAFSQQEQDGGLVTLLPGGELRKYRFVRLRYSPLVYDAGSGQLSVAARVTVRLSYQLTRAPLEALEAQDTLADEAASQILLNYDTAQGWYGAPAAQTRDLAGAVYDYVIVTTNAIEAGSSQLAVQGGDVGNETAVEPSQDDPAASQAPEAAPAGDGSLPPGAGAPGTEPAGAPPDGRDPDDREPGGSEPMNP